MVEKEMIRYLKSGDERAFGQVYLQFYTKVKFFINRLVRSEDDAEDLTQELFVRLWLNRNAIDEGKNLTNLIYVMARNISFSYLKGQSVKGVYENYAVQESEEPYEEMTDPFEEQEFYRSVNLAMDYLSERQQAVFRLSRLNGLSNDEIADTLHISAKSVSNQLSLALKRLTCLLKSDKTKRKYGT